MKEKHIFKKQNSRFFTFCILFFILCFLPFNFLYSAFEFRETGARGVALSGAFNAQSADATAPYWNPAGLRLVPQVELTSFYSQLFSIGDLSYMGTAVAVPSSFGGVGVAYSQFGPSAYREQQIYFSHGFELVEHVIAGYNLKGMFLKIEEYGSASTFGLDFAVLARIKENIQAGVVGKNVNHPSIGSSKEYLPYGFNAGVAFRPIQGLWLSGDLERIDPQGISLKSGIEFMVAQYFTVRAGMQNSPARFSGGFGAKAGIVRLDYAYQQNSNLPGSHEFSVTFKFGEPKEEIYRFKEKSSRKGKESKKPVVISPITVTKPAKTKFEGMLNLSTITVEDLTQIEEVGIVTAGEIVKYRDTVGFNSVDDLLKVPKMRKDVFNSIKDHVYLQPLSVELPEEKKEKEELPPLLEEIIPQPENVIETPAISTVPSCEQGIEEKSLEGFPVKISEDDKKEEMVKEMEPRPPKPNVNEMTSETLSDLGLNSIQVKNVLRYREKHGSFKSFEELKKLPGMDADTFEKIKDKIDCK